MNNSVNFTTPEASINSTTQSIGPLESLEICVYIINVLFGLPTHSYVIWLIITGTGSGVASEFFILNLSVCEIGNTLNCLFSVLSNWFSSALTLKLFLIGLSVTGRPLFQCLMCVERYLAVVHPVTFLKFKPLRYRVICCAVACIITLGSCLCCMLNLVSLTITADTWFISVQFLLFLSIQLFFLVTILRALKQEREKGGKPHEEKSVLSHSNNNSERGYHICAGYYYYLLTQLNIQEVWASAVICYVLAGFVQPVLYLHQNGKLLWFCAA